MKEVPLSHLVRHGWKELKRTPASHRGTRQQVEVPEEGTDGLRIKRLRSGEDGTEEVVEFSVVE